MMFQTLYFRTLLAPFLALTIVVGTTQGCAMPAGDASSAANTGEDLFVVTPLGFLTVTVLVIAWGVLTRQEAEAEKAAEIRDAQVLLDQKSLLLPFFLEAKLADDPAMSGRVKEEKLEATGALLASGPAQSDIESHVATAYPAYQSAWQALVEDLTAMEPPAREAFVADVTSVVQQLDALHPELRTQIGPPRPVDLVGEALTALQERVCRTATTVSLFPGLAPVAQGLDHITDFLVRKTAATLCAPAY